MTSNTAVNTMLLPVVAGLATASVALLASGQIVYGLITAVITFAAAYFYEILP